MPKPPAERSALAAEVWRRLFTFIIRTASHRNQVLGRYGLTPNDSRALYALDPGAGRTMGELAQEWGCDPSNATWMVDRLEKLGLAERRGVPGDRRVKQVALTAKGAKTKGKLSEELYRPPPELLELDGETLEALMRATEKLRAGPRQPGD